MVSISAAALTPIPTQDLADGPVTPGAVATKSILIGLQYNTVLPTLTNGQQASAQADSSGRLILSPLTTASTININNISGTVSLPTGASTSALQTQISGQLPATLGQKTMANSLAVAIASDQSAVPVTASTPSAGTITQAAITVGTSAVRLTVSGSAPSASRSLLTATMDVSSAATFYIGSSSVANSGASRGIPLLAGQTFTTNNDAGDYYIISSVAGQTVYVMEQA